MNVVIKRKKYTEKQVTGKLQVLTDKGVLFECKTLELADKNNEKRKSCIPRGQYPVEKRYSEKYGHHFHIQNVPNRDMILIHSGNFYTQILGCVLVGKDLIDMNKDRELDVTSSKETLNKLTQILPDKFYLTII